jgi:uncharacterized membrane protein YcaP (DUF421 family)
MWRSAVLFTTMYVITRFSGQYSVSCLFLFLFLLMYFAHLILKEIAGLKLPSIMHAV